MISPLACCILLSHCPLSPLGYDRPIYFFLLLFSVFFAVFCDIIWNCHKCRWAHRSFNNPIPVNVSAKILGTALSAIRFVFWRYWWFTGVKSLLRFYRFAVFGWGTRAPCYERGIKAYLNPFRLSWVCPAERKKKKPACMCILSLPFSLALSLSLSPLLRILPLSSSTSLLRAPVEAEAAASSGAFLMHHANMSIPLEGWLPQQSTPSFLLLFPSIRWLDLWLFKFFFPPFAPQGLCTLGWEFTWKLRVIHLPPPFLVVLLF